LQKLSASQEIPCLFLEPEVALLCTQEAKVGHTDPLHILTLHILNMDFNILKDQPAALPLKRLNLSNTVY